jgi:ABC-type oligopeptide transport system substrate-binding subunit/serine/threonine protein kinase
MSGEAEKSHGYEIGEQIGAGAYGTVHRAYQPAVGRDVAVKTILPKYADQPDFISRFEAEAQIIARLEHPHIVPLHDYWRDDDGAHLVMRLLDGGSLYDRLIEGPLDLGEAAQMVDQISSALELAHAQGIIHRDLKPSNILFDVQGNSYLTDFGIAKNLEAEVKLTATGAIIGTPDYIAPEQIRGEPLTPQADQYSLGIVLFEALTGRRPFDEDSIATLFHRHLTEPLPLATLFRPDLPPDVDLVLLRAASKQPSDRYPSVIELSVAFRRSMGQRYQRPATDDQAPIPAREAVAGRHPRSLVPGFLKETTEPERPVFVGRDRELAWLDSQLNTVLQGQSRVVFVTGEAGMGKSSLLMKFADRATEEQSELLTTWGSCDAFTGAGDPYLPFRDVLGVLAGDVEHSWGSGVLSSEQASRIWQSMSSTAETLTTKGSDLLRSLIAGQELLARLQEAGLQADGATAQWLPALAQTVQELPHDMAQNQLFDQVTTVLRDIATGNPLLIILDDLQWVDQASLNLLFHLGRRLSNSSVLIVGTFRTEEIAIGREGERHPLEKVVAELKRTFGEVILDLGVSDSNEKRDFINTLLDSEPNALGEDFRGSLLSHTGGHAFFVVEALRYLQETGDLVQDEDGRWVEGLSLSWDMLPDRVEGIIAERINRLEDELRDILTVAAVEGTDFTTQVVARVQQLQERGLLRMLSKELERQHRLVMERPSLHLGASFISRFRFTHNLFQQYLYNGLGPSERRLLHGEIGVILEELFADQVDDIAVQLAWHFTEAGKAGKATEYLIMAGDIARNLYALTDAASHYEKALSIFKEGGDFEQASRILMKLGLTYHSAFDYQRSQQAYEEGFSLRRQLSRMRPAAELNHAPHALRLHTHKKTYILDLARTSEAPDFTVIQQLFSGLVTLTPELDVLPDLARRWEVLDEGLVYIFFLREDAFWSDSVPVTARDFVFAWQRALDIAPDSNLALLLQPIKGVDSYHTDAVADQGTGPKKVEIGVYAVDDHTLRIELDQPCGYFLQLLAFVALPVPQHAVEIHGDTWTEPENIVSNGPFRIASWPNDGSLLMSRNSAYHGYFGGNLEYVKLIYHEQNEILPLYRADSLDILPLLALERSVRQEAMMVGMNDYLTVPEFTTGFIGFDVSQPPFDDYRVRRAFAMATDRQNLANVVAMGQVTPASGGFIPPGFPGHTADIALPYDLERARLLLAEAGYPNGQGLAPIKVQIWELLAYLCDFFTNSWQDGLGVEIKWELLRFSEHYRRISEDPPPIFWAAWGADYPDPDSFLRVGLRNQLNWQDEAYDNLVEEAGHTLDQALRIDLYRKAEQILVDRAPLIPLAYHRLHLLVKPWVKNYQPGNMRSVSWKDIIIEPH